MNWNEDKYKIVEEQKRCAAHDCVNEADDCDFVHPNIAKNVLATVPEGLMRKQPHPKQWRNWLQNPKAIIYYTNQHTLKMEAFNMSQVFDQMSTSAKLNVFHNMYINLLDENEKSLFLSDILGEQ